LRTRIFLLVAIAVAATVLIAFFATIILSPTQAPGNGRYLTYYPTHLTYGGNETRIFLVTSNARYGTYNQSFHKPEGGEVHEGDACVIINITIRNDYTKGQPGPDGYPDRPDDPFPQGYFVSLTAYLYNKDGQVNAGILMPGYMHGGFIDVNLETGETSTFEAYVAYDKQDIDHYELYILNIGFAPTR